MNSCRSDACCQGRKPCPCPDACRIPEMPPVPQFDNVDDAVQLLAGVALCALLAFLIVFVARDPFAFLSHFF